MFAASWGEGRRAAGGLARIVSFTSGRKTPPGRRDTLSPGVRAATFCFSASVQVKQFMLSMAMSNHLYYPSSAYVFTPRPLRWAFGPKFGRGTAGH